MQQIFVIRKANLLDAKACATIHQQEIATGFLSQLGVRFLTLLYTAMIRSQKVVCFVAEDEKGLVGFVSGCFHVSKFYREFFVGYGLKAFLILLPKIVKLSVFKKVFETAKYSSQQNTVLNQRDAGSTTNQLPQAELLAIAVRQNVRGTEVAQKLTEALFCECKKNNIQKIKVVVGAKNIQANQFYKKMGFELHSNIFVHKSEVSNVYVTMVMF